jgi:predicted transcriptional regulator
MAKPRPNPPTSVVRTREARAWELAQTGASQRRIAAELGIAQPSVCRILRRVETRVLAELEESVGRVKARQHHQLEHVADEALRAWERSQADTVTTKTTGAEVETTTRTNSGNPQHLQSALSALAAIRKLWGLEPKEAVVIELDGDTAEDVYAAEERRIAALPPAARADRLRFKARLLLEQADEAEKDGGDEPVPS